MRQDEDRNVPDFDAEEEKRIQRSNQIFLRLRKELNDREAQFVERDVGEAAQSARWLREILERYPSDWEQAYEDALTESDLSEEDEDYLQRGIQSAGGFLPFARRSLRRLEEADPGQREQASDSAAEVTRQDLMCGVVAGLIAGGVMVGNLFYFGFGIGMARKADCW